MTGSAATNTTVAMNQLLNPVKILGGMTMNLVPWGQNQYDAMLAKVEHRFSKGFAIINSFTWSKLFEDTSWTGPEIAGRHVEHKLGGEDRPFHLSIAPIWQLPIGRKQALRQKHAKGPRRRCWRMAVIRPVQHPVGRSGGLQHGLFLLG